MRLGNKNGRSHPREREYPIHAHTSVPRHRGDRNSPNADGQEENQARRFRAGSVHSHRSEHASADSYAIGLRKNSARSPCRAGDRANETANARHRENVRSRDRDDAQC